MSGGADEWRRRRSPCHGLVVRYVHALFYAFACTVWIQWIGCAGHSRHGTSASRAAAQVRRPRFKKPSTFYESYMCSPHGAVLNNPSFYSTSTTALPLACQSQPLTILIPQLIAVDGRPRRVVGCRVVFCTSVIRHPPRRRLPAVSSSASFASPSLSRIGPSSCQLTRRQPVQSYGS